METLKIAKKAESRRKWTIAFELMISQENYQHSK